MRTQMSSIFCWPQNEAYRTRRGTARHAIDGSCDRETNGLISPLIAGLLTGSQVPRALQPARAARRPASKDTAPLRRVE